MATTLTNKKKKKKKKPFYPWLVHNQIIPLVEKKKLLCPPFIINPYTEILEFATSIYAIDDHIKRVIKVTPYN